MTDYEKASLSMQAAMLMGQLWLVRNAGPDGFDRREVMLIMRDAAATAEAIIKGEVSDD